MVHELARWQLPLRMVVYGALVTGLAGCVAGLVIGLLVYAPTAWFATFEGRHPRRDNWQHPRFGRRIADRRGTDDSPPLVSLGRFLQPNPQPQERGTAVLEPFMTAAK